MGGGVSCMYIVTFTAHQQRKIVRTPLILSWRHHCLHVIGLLAYGLHVIVLLAGVLHVIGLLAYGLHVIVLLAGVLHVIRLLAYGLHVIVLMGSVLHVIRVLAYGSHVSVASWCFVCDRTASSFTILLQSNAFPLQVTTSQGRGRYFIREALQNKLLHNVVELLVRNQLFLEVGYWLCKVLYFSFVEIIEIYIILFNHQGLTIVSHRWVHKRCSGISGRLRYDADFH